MADFSRGTDGWELFAKYFELCKKYAEVQKSDQWFENMCKDFDNFTEIFRGTEVYEFAAVLSTGFMEWQGKEAVKKFGERWWEGNG